MVIVKINKNSIRKNPSAGRLDTFVPGVTMSDGCGGWIRNMERVHLPWPEPNFLFSYKDTIITCSHCKEQFSHKELIEGFLGSNNECDKTERVCPKCLVGYCCEKIEYEQLDQNTGKIITKEGL
jgi:hypothetical protein